ncbi:copper homeostasis protein CutC [Ferruginibacter sp. SUN106]|uniref:copper homeostasis protein CutC n=1 Tax=Ferruginibacter sp. SUN106 TaxID=2978348 RepID=UPI003D36689D
MNFNLEIIAFTIESCSIAQASGATRIELCDNPGDGGTTPSYGFIKAARAALNIELYCMIRPRGGDFFYSDAEFEIMKSDVQMCKQLGCDGVVIGMLNKDGSVDKERSKQLVTLAYPTGVTFQRAFDRVNDPFKALEDVIETGCERILTSGLVPNCLDGAPLIARLVQQANGRIVIMPGSGLRSSNVIEVAAITGATEFHTSARIFEATTMDFVVAGMEEDLTTVIVDGKEVQAIAALLKSYQQG